MNQCVSIVVPVYNTEEFLEECFHSIVQQTHQNLQIIVLMMRLQINLRKLLINIWLKIQDLKVLQTVKEWE